VQTERKKQQLYSGVHYQSSNNGQNATKASHATIKAQIMDKMQQKHHMHLSSVYMSGTGG